jgi:riboflavin biosynthesis pyrimidine reductase
MTPLERLLPTAGPRLLDAEQAYGDLQLASRAPADRPYVIVNMISTADGQGRIGSDTAELGNEDDMALFAVLREQVDCVMAGVRTVAVENYKGPGGKQRTRERRETNGLAPRPLFATATRSGELPVNTPLFQDPEATVVVFSNAELKLDGARALVTQVRAEEPQEMLRMLRQEHGVRSLLLEGGPHINTPFFAEEFVDELFLTIAPVLTGDAEFPIIAGALPTRQSLHIVGMLTSEDHLYLRYRVD